jgi:hypothetical protein
VLDGSYPSIVKFDAQPGFLDLKEPELYQIMASPIAGRLDPVFWADYPLPFVIGGAGAIAIELSSPLLLTRWGRYWAVLGAAMHVGIALTMELGVFSWGMLALYPVLLSPWTERMLDRLAPWLPDGGGPPAPLDHRAPAPG